MQLPQSEARQAYIAKIKAIEAQLKEATTGKINHSQLMRVQNDLDALAERYQYAEKIGSARYKLYELQALVHFFKDEDDEALDFVNQAVETRGSTYARAEKLRSRLLERSGAAAHMQDEPPLQLQALIRGQRTSAVIMAVLSVLSIYLIPWAIFYIILAIKLTPRRVPDRGLIKAAAIVTLPLCLGIIPIIIDMEFWKMNKKLEEYERLGAKAFTSDKEYASAEPKRKRGQIIAWSILGLFVGAFLVIVMIAALSSSSRQGVAYQTPMEIASRGAEEAKENTSFPYEVDDITTLTDITSSGSVVQYHYVLHGVDASSLTNDALRSNVQPNVCANTSTKSLLSRGVGLQYLYTVQETSARYSFTIYKGDC